ncbi:MAG: hypothetical protein ACLGIB_01920 [Actinomycetota bacterium]
MEDRDLARLLAWGRIGIGGALALAPSTFVRLWTGRPQPGFPAKMMGKGFGVRELAIGVGLLTALESGGNVKPWLLATAAADAGDAAGTLGSWGELGSLRALGFLVLEVGAAVIGFSLAESLD